MMTQPVRYDLHIDRGITFRREIEWQDPAGTPVDLTGYRVLFQIRSSATTPDAFLEFDSDTLLPGQTLGPLGPTGVIAFELSDEVTDTIPSGLHTWDLIVESASGDREKLAYGQVYVLATVTRGP